MLARCEELTPDLLEDEDRLDRGDFVIARIVWNEEKQKFHDHSAIIENRLDLHCKCFQIIAYNTNNDIDLFMLCVKILSQGYKRN